MKKRHTVLMLLCVLSIITFLDRLALPVAESGIRSDLHLSEEQWGWVLGAYILANAIFEIPSGALGDRHGRRKELARIVTWWSFFTAMTGWCRGFLQIVASRFLFGMGAAGAYPNAAGVISRWFPKKEHARAQGFVWGASRLGGALAPLLLVPLARSVGWRGIFWCMGAIGFVWVALWLLLFRESPEGMPGISIEELIEIGSPTITSAEYQGAELQEKVPWSRLFHLPDLWLLSLAYFCYAWGSWFFFGWFTTWLVRSAHFTVAEMGIWASLPFLMGLAGNIVGGVLSEWLVIRFGRRRAYRWVTAICLSVAACLLYGMTTVQTHTGIIVLATAGFGVMDLMLPSAWAMAMGLGGNFGGTASGVMNTAGNLGGWVCTIVFGYVVKFAGSYDLPVRMIAGMILLAAVIFARVDCTRGLETADDPA